MNMKFRMRVESQKDNWFLSLALLSTNGKHYRYLQSMLNGKNLPVEPIFDGNHTVSYTHLTLPTILRV